MFDVPERKVVLVEGKKEWIEHINKEGEIPCGMVRQ